MKVRKILVVDNNATIVELVGSLLTEEGYEVDKAYDGIGALDRLEEAEVLPDAILLDLVMPKIDGQRLTRILKTDERYAHIPIVILSGIAAEENSKIFAFGADAFIAKGKIDETFKHIQETLKWIEERPESTEKRGEVLGVEKLFPREMTKELLLVKEHFDSMFNLMQEGVIEIDQDHRVLFLNPAAQRLLCLDNHQLFGKPVQDLFEDKSAIGDYLDALPRKPDETSESIQLTCGQYITRAIASPFFLEGEYIGAIIIIQDITSLIHREKSLEGQMAAIVENAPVGLCLLNGEGLVHVANHSLSRILRQGPDWKPVGLNILEFLATMSPPLSEALQNILALAPGKMLAHKAGYLPPGEQVRQVLNFTAKALEGGGARFLLLVEDVTEKTLLEENLRRVNDELDKASKSKSTFLSMVSHELRTPLSVVRGYISLILEGKIGPDADQMQAALKVADKRARHLQHLIEELLDLSRIEAGKLSIKRENLEIAKHVRETVEMFRDDQEQKELEIVLDIPDGLPPVFADHDKVHQVFTNLVSNAIKFSNRGGKLVIAAKQEGNWAEIKVSDSGVGIPADRIDRIFEKFYQVDSSDTRKHAGTGLGLSIVKMIIAALGGSIHVTSEIGKGTTFTFTLPLGTAATPGVEVSTAPAPEPVREVPTEAKKRVLVVEDDPDTLELIRIFLEDESYEVTVANDAFLGLKEFFRQTPDFVLADALLPLMTGLDLCRVIKNNPETSDLPVVILSAAAQEDEIRSGYEVGADAYLVKPVTSQDLIETIRKHTPLGPAQE